VEPGPPIDGGASPLQETGELVARWQRGERSAADELYRRYHPRLNSLLRARLPAGARRLGDTDDLVHDVYLKILGALPRFEMRGISSFWCFARTIALNHVVDAARRHHAIHETGMPESDGVPPAPARGPVGEAIDHESAAAFDRALARVPEPVRSAILLRIELDLDWATIAVECGFPSPDAARVAVKRGLGVIAKEMAGHGETT